MSLIQPTRRGLIGALIAGPAIVRVASIMPVRAPPIVSNPFTFEHIQVGEGQYLRFMFRHEDGIIRSTRIAVL